MKMMVPKLTVAVAALTFMAGCIVLSVYPFYTAKDLIFDPALAGRWAETGKANAFWQFADLNGRSYLLTSTDQQATNVFEAHLFRLKDQQFLDLLTTNRGEFQLPMHLISKLERADTNLSLQFMDFGWLAGLLETNPAVLRHIVVPMEPGSTNEALGSGDNNMFYLTADTKDLQKFLLQHAHDTNAFNAGSAVSLERVSP